MHALRRKIHPSFFLVVTTEKKDIRGITSYMQQKEPQDACKELPKFSYNTEYASNRTT